MTDAAWLIFGEHKRHRAGRAGWLRRQPIGVKVLDEVLEEGGAETGVCSPAKPHDDVVLVSLTSEHDVIAFYRAVAGLEEWQPGRRKFRVVAGGYGVQNPHPLRRFVDYAYFGRAEMEVVDLVAAAGRGDAFESESVMLLPEIHPVAVRQPVTLYDGMVFHETFTGCPLACKFCHYTFARKHTGADHAYSRNETTAGAYVQTAGHQGTGSVSSIEITWPQFIEWPHERYYSDVTAGLDGCSERLRWLYGKRISRAEFVEGLSNYAHGLHDSGVAGAKVKLYDIAFPAEDGHDRAELAEDLAKVDCPHGIQLFVMVQVTPFKASAWTPMQWEAFEMRNFRHLAGRRIATWHEDDECRAWAMYSNTIESPASQCEYATVTRHDGSEAADRAMRIVALSNSWRKLRSAQRVQSWRHEVGPWSDFALGAHPLEAEMPTQVARGVADVSTLRKIAERMRADEAATLADREHRRGRRTIMGRTRIPVAAA